MDKMTFQALAILSEEINFIQQRWIRQASPQMALTACLSALPPSSTARSRLADSLNPRLIIEANKSFTTAPFSVVPSISPSGIF